MLIIVVMLTGVTLRVLSIESRTIHLDETVALSAADQILSQSWKFYPQNGHGPTLFYAAAAIKKIAGDDILPGRLFNLGVFLVTIALLLFAFSRILSIAGKIVLVAGMSLSPGFVYYNGSYIHETLFVFFTCLLVTSVMKFFQTKKDAWIVAAIASSALLYATKETALLTFLALAPSGVFLLMRDAQRRDRLGDLPMRVGVIGLFAACAIHIALFTSFFTNAQGFFDSVRAPMDWAGRALSMHQRPADYFVVLLGMHEWPLIVAMLASLFPIVRRHQWNDAIVASALWFVMELFLYSIIPYKTPWCALNIVLPLIITVAVASDALWRAAKAATRRTFIVVAVFLCAASAVNAYVDAVLDADRVTETSYAYLQSGKSLRAFDWMVHAAAGSGTSPMMIGRVGEWDELLTYLTKDLHVTSDTGGLLPAIINYQSDADVLSAKLGASGARYVRATFTYIEHLNQIDLFIEKSTFARLQKMPDYPQPVSEQPSMIDYRYP